MILCTCSRGHVRSYVMARVLRENGFDAINAGLESNSHDTLTALRSMAAQVIDCVAVLGEDVWRSPCSGELRDVCVAWLNSNGFTVT